MKLQKLVFALTFTLYSLTANTATVINQPLNANDCKSLISLNQTMRTSLKLSDVEIESLQEINRAYLLARKQILASPKMVGQNTALLACWDKWRLTLEKSFTKTQVQQFMQWQSEVDLLSAAPF